MCCSWVKGMGGVMVKAAFFPRLMGLVGGLAAFPLLGGPVVPDSLPVTVLIPKSNFNSAFKAAFPAISQTQEYDEVSGTLFTRINSKDREKIGGPPLRMKPLITFGSDSQWDWGWRESDSLAIALDRLRQNQGALLFETEDGTWSLGKPLGIRVREGFRESIFLSVEIRELLPPPQLQGGTRTRVMNIPIEDVSDRVFRTSSVLAAALSADEAGYFLSGSDDGVFPVSVLGFERDSVWVCSSADLKNSGAKPIQLFLVKQDLLRWAPQAEILTLKRRSIGDFVALGWLRLSILSAVEIPAGTKSRIEYVQEQMKLRRPEWKTSLDLPPSNCRVALAPARSPT